MDNWTKLLEKYMAGTLGATELEAFLAGADDHADEMEATVLALLQSQYPLHFGEEERRQRILQHILKQDRTAEEPEDTADKKAPRRIPVYSRVSVAAAVLLVAVSAWWLLNKKGTPPPASPTAAAVVVKPGANAAVLTLADGSTIILDSAGNGQVGKEHGMQIINAASGALSYKEEDAAASAAVVYNTLTTPRGGQYQVTLSDGTRVYLNADSKLEYPTRFAGSTRNVTIKGEAYFEVAQNVRKPFVVLVGGRSQLEVLGTSFNINAYEDEPAQYTTLVTGKVKVRTQGAGKSDSVILQPGQQTVEAQGLTVRSADIDQVLAWKNGIFNFEGLDFKTGMRQLARWYNVDLVFKGNKQYGALSGEMDRGLTIEDVIAFLSKLHVHCTLEGRTLVVE